MSTYKQRATVTNGYLLLPFRLIKGCNISPNNQEVIKNLYFSFAYKYSSVEI